MHAWKLDSHVYIKQGHKQKGEKYIIVFTYTRTYDNLIHHCYQCSLELHHRSTSSWCILAGLHTATLPPCSWGAHSSSRPCHHSSRRCHHRAQLPVGISCSRTGCSQTHRYDPLQEISLRFLVWQAFCSDAWRHHRRWMQQTTAQVHIYLWNTCSYNVNITPELWACFTEDYLDFNRESKHTQIAIIANNKHADNLWHRHSREGYSDQMGQLKNIISVR